MITAGPFTSLIDFDSSHAAHDLQRRELQQRLAVGDDLLGLGVETFAVVGETLVHVGRHGAIEKHGHFGNLLGIQQPIQVIDQLLGPLDGEDGNDHLAAAGDRLGNHLLQLRLDRAVIFVIAVAVGRFHHDVIGLGEDRRVADDRPVPLAQVAGENDSPRLAVIAHAQFDHRRAENVAGVVEHGVDVVVDPHRPIVGHASNSGSVRSTSRMV